MVVILPTRLISNASGVHCVGYTSLTELFDSSATHIVTKSCTENPRMGNPHPRYWCDEYGSINASGLPNLGYQSYRDYDPPSGTVHKSYILSVAGLTLEENIRIFKSIGESPKKVCGIELNMSCPNVQGKSQVGYDLEAMDKYLGTLIPLLPSRATYPDFSFGVKLPPYFDPSHFDQAASVLTRYQRLDSVTTINSLGNGLLVDTKTRGPVITPRGGLGGVGGRYCLPTALGNVRQHYIRLASHCKQIVGCGGISDGDTMYQHILCGASSVQIGTQLCEEGPTCFARIISEFSNLCDKKGHDHIYTLRGDFSH